MAFFINAQNNVLKKLETIKDDSLKCVFLINEIENEDNPEVWIIYNNKLKTISSTTSKLQKQFYFFKSSESVALNNYGFYLSNNLKPDSALLYYFQSLDLLLDINNIKEEINTLNNIAFLYYNTGNYNLALKYYEKCIALASKNKNHEALGVVYNNLSNLYYSLKDTLNGTKFMQKAFFTRVKLGDSIGIAKGYNAFASIYYIENKKDSAFYYIKQAILIYNRFNNKLNLANAYNNLGIFYDREKNFDSSAFYINKALTIYNEQLDVHGQAMALIALGACYLHQNKPELAQQKFLNALKIAKGINNKNQIIDCYFSLSSTYFALNNYKEAYLALKNYYDESVKLHKAKTIVLNDFKNGLDSSNTQELNTFKPETNLNTVVKTNFTTLEIVLVLFCGFLIGVIIYMFYYFKKRST